MSDLEEAAKNYVAARIANEAAEPRDWSGSVALVDMYWHDMLVASGLLEVDAYVAAKDDPDSLWDYEKNDYR